MPNIPREDIDRAIELTIEVFNYTIQNSCVGDAEWRKGYAERDFVVDIIKRLREATDEIERLRN